MTRGFAAASCLLVLLASACTCGSGGPPDASGPYCVPIEEAPFEDVESPVSVYRIALGRDPWEYPFQLSYNEMESAPDGAARLTVDLSQTSGGYGIDPMFAIELDVDGRVRLERVERLVRHLFWAPQSLVWSWSTHSEILDPDPSPLTRPPTIRWDDLATGDVHAALLPDELWERPSPRCSVYAGVNGLHVDEEHLWLFRELCDDAGSVELHVFGRDGAETTPPEGVAMPPPRGVHGLPPGATALASDGTMWVTTYRSGSDGVMALRAVHYAADGTELAVSPPLADDAVIGVERGNVRAPWGATTADGAYLVHFVARNGRDVGYASHIARVDPDGSIRWKWFGPGRVPAAGGELLEEPRLTEIDGGVAALLVQYEAPRRIFLLHITADGGLPLGDAGALLVDLSTLPGSSSVYDILEAALTPDGAGGLWISWTNVGGWSAMRIALDGTVVVPELRVGRRGRPELYGILRLSADQRGGVWALSSVQGFWTRLQHLSADGDPLFFTRRYKCQPDDPDYVRDTRYETAPLPPYLIRTADGGLVPPEEPTLDAGVLRF